MSRRCQHLRGPIGNRRAGILLALMLATSVPGGCGASQGDAKVIGTWVPVEVPSEQWGTDFDPAKAAITFNDDGDWIASDGCNHNQGEYSIDGEEFTSPLASNLGGVGCPYGTVPYEELLAAADRLEATQKELRFYDGGTMILRVQRQD